MLALFDRTIRFSLLTLLGVCSSIAIAEAGGDQIVHDAEYYILEAQNGDRWDAEDEGLQQRLAELREKYKAPPISFTSCGMIPPTETLAFPQFRRFEGLKLRV